MTSHSKLGNTARIGAQQAVAAASLTIAALAIPIAGVTVAVAVASLGVAAILISRKTDQNSLEPAVPSYVLIVVTTLLACAARYHVGYPEEFADVVGWARGALDGRMWFVGFVVAPTTALLFGGYLVTRRLPGAAIAAWWAVLFAAVDGITSIVVIGRLDWSDPVLCGAAVLGGILQLLLATVLAQRLLRQATGTAAPADRTGGGPRERNLWTVLIVAAVGVYGAAVYAQSGPLPVGIIVGSMIGGLIGWRRTTARVPADPATHVPLFLLLLALFYLHVGEEALTHFNRAIAEISNTPWSDGDFTTLIGLLGPAVWVFGIWSLWHRQPLGNFIYWFLIVGMILGEPTHLLVFPVMRMAQEGVGYGYFSGMSTALFPMIPAILGLRALVRQHRDLKLEHQL